MIFLSSFVDRFRTSDKVPNPEKLELKLIEQQEMGIILYKSLYGAQRLIVKPPLENLFYFVCFIVLKR